MVSEEKRARFYKMVGWARNIEFSKKEDFVEPDSQKEKEEERIGWKKWGTRKRNNEFSSSIVPWIIAIIFGAGTLYAYVMKIPAIEQTQSCQALKINTIETKMDTMKDDMVEIKGDIKILLRRSK